MKSALAGLPAAMTQGHSASADEALLGQVVDAIRALSARWATGPAMKFYCRGHDRARAGAPAGT